MKKLKLLKEISYGAFTLAIFLVIIILYFSKFNGDMTLLREGMAYGNNTQVIPTGYITSNDILINNASCEVKWPSERTIILRMDDVQSFAWAGISMNITDTILQKNKSIVLGVIPGRLVERKNGINLIADYLENKSSDNRIEVAVHGDNHVENEFNVSENTSYEMIKDGIMKIENVVHRIPTTFIPPNNVFSEESEKSLSKLGIYIISSDQDYYRYENNIYEIGYSATTKHSDIDDITPVDEVVDRCNNAINLRNICVIMMHPQDYVNGDGVTMNQTRYVQFIKLLDGLDKLNATYSTFNKLLVCQNASSNATSQLTVSHQ